jgi:DNA repair exonuclease SbcCD nuclease subunit
MTRNVYYDFAPDVAFLGDPHLGKRFLHDVPRHRRGERETMTLDGFDASLEDQNYRAHVMMGDLFDTPIVSPSVLLRAIKAYRNTSKPCFVIVGNHDCGQRSQVTSIDILQAALADKPNVHFVGVNQSHNYKDMTLFGWMTEDFVMPSSCGLIAVGHWDVVDFGGSHSVVPVSALKAAGAEHFITGHDHVRREVVLEGETVNVTGSMFPYSFSQDPDEEIYVTLTAQEFLARDPLDFKDKAVRVIGEIELSEPLDCLQFKIKKNIEDIDIDDDEEVSLEGLFDLRSVINREVKDNPLAGEALVIFDEAMAEETND